MFKLKITAKAKKQIKNISKLHQEAVIEAFEVIKEEPQSGKPLTKELFSRYSFRVGVHRIIYLIDFKDKIITIISAGHRSKTYLWCTLTQGLEFGNISTRD